MGGDDHPASVEDLAQAVTEEATERAVAADALAGDVDPTDRADGIADRDAIREETGAVVDEIRSPDGDGACPHCDLVLPESGPSLCPRCGAPRRFRRFRLA